MSAITRSTLAALLLSACGSTSKPATGPTPTGPTAAQHASFSTSKVALPGGNADGVLMDFLLYNSRTKTVWAPVGNTGAVDVIDIGSGKMSRIEGFTTHEMERHGKTRTVGPSSATLGVAGTVYVGNRGDFSVCAVDEIKLVRGTCTKLDSMPDGISFVAKTNEVWVTTPRDQSIRILDATTLVQKVRLPFDGEPEGYAPDATRGRFYTNLEDKDLTLAIDIASHQTVATWKPNCGENGPHGIRLDEKTGLLVIACDAKVQVLDVGQTGAVVGSLAAGDGLDDVDYDPSTRTVYAGAAKTGNLTIASLDSKGTLKLETQVPTEEGARNGVVTANGSVYLAASKVGELFVVTPK